MRLMQKLDETEQLFAHRWWWARQLGLDEMQADQVASASLDMHALEDLLARGCPFDLAFAILS